MSKNATEALTVDQAEALLPTSQAWIDSILRRIGPHLPERRPLRVLDVGAAQGRAVIALARAGCEAYGVEPWADARATGEALAARVGATVVVKEGRAEAIPFEDGFFDVVLAMSVMEHVGDLDASLREIARVLRPGGVFWFNSASSLCPDQREIDGFPLFGWYPDPLKRRIMLWAKDHRPELVGHTDAPAMHWWTPWKARRLLRGVGFTEIWDRWDLKETDGLSAPKRAAVEAVRALPPLKLAGDVVVRGCSFLARKG